MRVRPSPRRRGPLPEPRTEDPSVTCPLLLLWGAMPSCLVIAWCQRGGGILRAVVGLRAQEVAQGLELIAADSALPKVMGETDQDRGIGGAGQVELDPKGEQVEALRAGDLLGLRLGDVTQQALDHAWVH